MQELNQQYTVLIVDDEESIVHSLEGVFTDEGYHVLTARTGEEGLALLQTEPVDLIFLDVWLPGIDGLETLRVIKETNPLISVIMISGHSTIDTAVDATKMGAYYFIEKPIDLDKILIITRRALEKVHLEQENLDLRRKIEQRYEMIGRSPLFLELIQQIKAAAPSNSRVLIAGENGTGKELVARAIHNESRRRTKPFIEVNCAAIPDELIESELFGHEKGAFTGATARKAGKFELADGGTIFLDEVGDMSLKTQAKVLRVLEQQKIERVGGTATIPIDVRVITASNKDLLKESIGGSFREDLYYRLNVIPLVVPPLRERKDDIPLLCKYFLDLFCRENGKKLKKLAKEALDTLIAYPWPGNIRELKNILERLVIMVPREKIEVEDIPPLYRKAAEPTGQQSPIDPSSEDDFGGTLKEARDNFERNFILQKLEQNAWNVSKTAELLKIERSNLHRKMKQLGIASAKDEEND
jgi:two-component system, NtrC family, nitrogen regulation response regulator NtrX